MAAADSIIEAIRDRISVRTYKPQPVEPEKREEILRLLRTHTLGPFGNSVRFELLDLTEVEQHELKSLGTYGVISGATLYIVAVVRDTEHAMEDTGYCFERIILEARRLGLGTCWMGGTFKRAGFAAKAGVSAAEIVPAVSPVGYPDTKRSIKDKAIRRFAKSDTRKPWTELFFEADFETPLADHQVGDYATPLECVRLGPSASNLQPWRILREPGTQTYHLFLKRTRGYNRALKAADLQQIDMGIAMCHFEVAARETGLSGRWAESKPSVDAGTMEYVSSWVPE